MSHLLRVLLVEDSEDDALLLVRELRRGGLEPTHQRVETQDEFKACLATSAWDIVISDHALPHYSGLRALADLQATGKDIPFILVSGTIGEELAVQVMKAGAHDYVLKDHLARLPAAVEREVREAASRAEQRRMRDQLVVAERMASAGTLAAGLCHEINNPLAIAIANLDYVVDALAELIPKGDRLVEVVAPLGDTREAVHRIRDIVRDVKLFSRPQKEDAEPVDVRRVIDSSIRMAWNEIRHRAQLVKDYGDTPLVSANEARLGQVLLNLIVNAAQAIPEGNASGNEIRIVTRSEGGLVAIEVHDTGKGIPQEILDRIFDPFFTTKPVGVGTGLGLAICHRLVTEFGGEISVQSKVGKGTTFRLSLPAATEETVKVKPAAAPVASTPRARILVVDDEAAIGTAIQRSLARHHDVVALASGKEALTRLASGEHFDLIISDVMMPEVTGIMIYEELLRRAPDQARRMIFMTGGAFTIGSREFLSRVPNACVEKPFDMATLRGTIAGVLMRDAGTAA